MMSSKKYKQKNKLVGGKDHMPDWKEVQGVCLKTDCWDSPPEILIQLIWGWGWGVRIFNKQQRQFP